MLAGRAHVMISSACNFMGWKMRYHPPFDKPSGKWWMTCRVDSSRAVSQLWHRGGREGTPVRIGLDELFAMARGDCRHSGWALAEIEQVEAVLAFAARVVEGVNKRQPCPR